MTAFLFVARCSFHPAVGRSEASRGLHDAGGRGVTLRLIATVIRLSLRQL